jgi:hypothetical protein
VPTVAEYPVEYQQYTQFQLYLTLLNPDGTPVDLTGCTALMQVRNAPDGTLAFSTVPELGGTAGTVYATGDESDLAGVAPDVYDYDIRIVDSLGEPHRLIQGTFTVTPGVAQA